MINRVIKAFVFSDLILLFGWGLINPILAIFVIQNIVGATAKTAGIAIGIYWLSKSVLQIPIAKFLDKNHGERDDFYALFFGIILASLVPLGFLISSLPRHVYLLEALHGLGMALAIPAWSGIFTRHIEKGREAFCWSLDSSALGIGAGLAGIIGGYLVGAIGFSYLFLFVFIFGIISASILFAVKKELLPKGKTIIIPKQS